MIEPCSRRAECPYVIDANNRADTQEARADTACFLLNAVGNDINTYLRERKTKPFDRYGRAYTAPEMETSDMHGVGKVVKAP